MKQLLPLFLFLLPCLAWAQYPSNGNQKITLGEQSTADRLVYRGVASTDTVRKPSIDTMAYMVLDTTTNIIWHYKKATSNAWLRLNLLPSDTASMLTPYFRDADTTTLNLTSRFNTKQNTLISASNIKTINGVNILGSGNIDVSGDGGGGVTTFTAGSTGFTPNTATSGAVTLGGTLAVANGGTNRTTMPAGYILHGDGTSVDTAIGLFYDRSNRWLGLGLNNPEYNLHLKNSLPIQIFLEGTSTSTHAAMYFTNSRSTDFTSYGGFLYGGTNQTQPLFGLNRNDKLFLFSDGSNNLGMIVGTLSNQPLYFGTNNTERMRIASGGAVTINNLAGINDVGADANGKLQAATSDINLKNTIENSPFGLNEILLLSPVTFLYNDTDRKIDSNVKEVGFIAQDVFDIIPNAVSSTGTGDLQLDYRAITATLVKAIQEQQALIKALEQRIINLENK